MFVEILFLLCLLVIFGYVVYVAFHGFPIKKAYHLSIWEQVAIYCLETFGSHIDWEERFFICPDCQEPLYECDWTDPCDYLSEMCPICDYHWYETEQENDDRKAAGNEWYSTEEDEEMDEIDEDRKDWTEEG